MDDITVGKIISMSIKLYALMTPPAVLSAFISGTRSLDRERKALTACKTSVAIFIIGTFLFLFGSHLFTLFGFTLDAFRIGVGLLLFLTAISLMNDDCTNRAPGRKATSAWCRWQFPWAWGLRPSARSWLWAPLPRA